MESRKVFFSQNSIWMYRVLIWMILRCSVLPVVASLSPTSLEGELEDLGGHRGEGLSSSSSSSSELRQKTMPSLSESCAAIRESDRCTRREKG
jgi:hypothetical protein